MPARSAGRRHQMSAPTVIPSPREARSPESITPAYRHSSNGQIRSGSIYSTHLPDRLAVMDSGLAPLARPGMTVAGYLSSSAPRAAGADQLPRNGAGNASRASSLKERQDP